MPPVGPQEVNASTLSTIGFIGLGTMGRAMALNLVRSGFTVRGHDQLESAVNAVVAEGVVPAKSPADAASGAELVITMLPNIPDIEAVLTGVDGVMNTPGNGRRLMNSSTINHAAKDLGIATGAMEREGIPCFVGAAALEAYIEARKDNRGDNDWSDIYNLVGDIWRSKKT